MKLSQRLDIVVLVLIILYVLTGCTTGEILDTMSKFNAEKSTYSPYGCLQDEVLWRDVHGLFQLQHRRYNRRSIESKV